MKRFIKSAIACIAAVAMIATAVPVTAHAAKKTETVKTVTVKNQKELESAIKDGATKITIKTGKNVKITIPESKDAAKVEFVVNAKKATVTNKASVKSLTVVNAKAFTESGKNNDIKIATDKKLTVTVAKSAKGADIQVAAEGANVKIVANGEVNSVAVAKSDAKVVINGTSDSKIDVTVSKPGAKVSTSVPVAVTADRRATIVIAKGADGSTVTANASVKLAVAKEATVDKVEVTTDANVNLIAKGTVSDVTVAKEAEGAKLNINASGTVESVTVDAKADVAVGGTTTETVKVTVNAADTTVKADTAVDTTLNADAKVDLGAGAEGSSVTQGSADVKVDVSNGTSESITITDSTGKDTTVDAGKDQSSSTDSGKTEDNKNNGGSTSGGGYYPSTPDPVDPDYDFVDKASVFVNYEGHDPAVQIHNNVKVEYDKLSKTCELGDLKQYIKDVCKKCKDLSASGDQDEATDTNSVKETVGGKKVTIMKKTAGAGQTTCYTVSWTRENSSGKTTYIALIFVDVTNKQITIVPKDAGGTKVALTVDGTPFNRSNSTPITP